MAGAVLGQHLTGVDHPGTSGGGPLHGEVGGVVVNDHDLIHQGGELDEVVTDGSTTSPTVLCSLRAGRHTDTVVAPLSEVRSTARNQP